MFEFALATLLTYRLARMAAIEDGPFDVFAKLQERIGQKSWVGRGIRCVLCLSFWIAMPVTLLLNPADWRAAVLLWGGIAGAVVIIHKVIA